MKNGPKMCVSSCLMQLNCAFYKKIYCHTLCRACVRKDAASERTLFAYYRSSSISTFLCGYSIELKAILSICICLSSSCDIAFQRSTPQCTQNEHLV